MIAARSLANEDYGPTVAIAPPQKFVFAVTSPLQA
ncbi:hypothetical protein KLQUCP338B2_15425 [Klebsiella quasipneumoniae subsp. similipneumoniae]|nr:Uncharacterised protein [Klebsiella quasipneumoniae]